MLKRGVILVGASMTIGNKPITLERNHLPPVFLRDQVALRTVNIPSLPIAEHDLEIIKD